MVRPPVTSFEELLKPGPLDNDSACRGLDVDVFFPTYDEGALRAKLICRECPVKDLCLELHLHEEVGVWGGKSERERRALRRSGLVASLKYALVDVLDEWMTVKEMGVLPGLEDIGLKKLTNMCWVMRNTRLTYREHPNPGRSRFVNQYRRKRSA